MEKEKGKYKIMNFSLPQRYLRMLISYGLGRPLYAPDSVSIIVADKCNLRCVMCNFWKDNDAKADGITLDEFQILFRDLRSMGTRSIQLTGGEPFLRSDLNDILRAAKKNALQTAVVTNATLITADNVRKFLSNTDLIYISLDAPSKNQHEDIRNVPNIFEKIIKSVKLLVGTRKANSFSTRIILCATITPRGIHEPARMVDLAQSLGVDGLIYNPASRINYGYTTLKSELENNRIFSDAYSKMIDKIITLMSDSRNLIRSNPFYLAASKEFLNGDKRYYKFPCLGGGYNGPLIAFNGAVFPCCAWNASLGNIRREPFSRIWASQRAREIRLKIKRMQCPVCYHHTRTFDFALRAPVLFRNPARLLRGYRMLMRI